MARAWPEVSRHLSAQFIRDYVRWYRLWSNWARTVTDGGEPVGVIMARLERDFGRMDRYRATLWALRSLAWVALGRFGRPRRPYRFLRSLITTELEAQKLLPPADGELTLLLLDEAYQRRGIGRRLVEDFVEYARAAGAEKLTLITDEDSNWHFYEHLGWKRMSEFQLEFDALLAGREVTGYVYALDLGHGA